MTSAAATEKEKEFWAKLDSIKLATEKAELILEHTKGDNKDDADGKSSLLKSKCPASGRTLTEYLWSLNNGPDGRKRYKEHSIVNDCFDHLVYTHKIPDWYWKRIVRTLGRDEKSDSVGLSTQRDRW